MGSILTFLREHWPAVLIFIAIQMVIYIFGYLRGHWAGEASEIERKSRTVTSLNRDNQRLRERIDFIQAENDEIRRRHSALMQELGRPVIFAPPRGRSPEAEALGLVGRLDPLPQGPRISREVLKALGPSEPPTPKDHKEVG